MRLEVAMSLALSVAGLAAGACSMDVRGLETGAGPGTSPGAPDARAGQPDAGATLDVVDARPAAAADATAGTTGPVRPYRVAIPARYSADREWPLLVLLHGYSVNGWLEDFYLGLADIVDQKGFLLAVPDGLADATGLRFWNATDACCNWYGSTVDDVAYLDWVIEDMAARYRVDRSRVFVMGHSNGAFMAYRMACDRAGKLAGIVSLEGATWLDDEKCRPSRPVSVLHVHGTWDALVLYGGGRFIVASAGYPSAKQSVAAWARHDGCSDDLAPRGRLNLEALILGYETEAEGYAGCEHGSDVELWTIHGGSHIPIFHDEVMGRIVDWLVARPAR